MAQMKGLKAQQPASNIYGRPLHVPVHICSDDIIMTIMARHITPLMYQLCSYCTTIFQIEWPFYILIKIESSMTFYVLPCNPYEIVQLRITPSFFSGQAPEPCWEDPRGARFPLWGVFDGVRHQLRSSQTQTQRARQKANIQVWKVPAGLHWNLQTQEACQVKSVPTFLVVWAASYWNESISFNLELTLLPPSFSNFPLSGR